MIPIRATTFCLAIAAVFPAAAPVGQPAQPIGAPDPEIRAHVDAFVDALRGASADAYEAMAQANYAPAFLARRTPAERRTVRRTPPRRLRRHHRPARQRDARWRGLDVARARRHWASRGRYRTASGAGSAASASPVCRLKWATEMTSATATPPPPHQRGRCRRRSSHARSTAISRRSPPPTPFPGSSWWRKTACLSSSSSRTASPIARFVPPIT